MMPKIPSGESHNLDDPRRFRNTWNTWQASKNPGPRLLSQ